MRDTGILVLLFLSVLCRSWKYATMIFEGISFSRTNSNPIHKVRFVAQDLSQFSCLYFPLEFVLEIERSSKNRCNIIPTPVKRTLQGIENSHRSFPEKSRVLNSVLTKPLDTKNCYNRNLQIVIFVLLELVLKFEIFSRNRCS